MDEKAELTDIKKFLVKLKNLERDIKARVSDTELIIKIMQRLNDRYSEPILQGILNTTEIRMKNIIKEGWPLTEQERYYAFAYLNEDRSSQFKPLREVLDDHVYSAYLVLGSEKAARALRIGVRSVQRRVRDFKLKQQDLINGAM